MVGPQREQYRRVLRRERATESRRQITSTRPSTGSSRLRRAGARRVVEEHLIARAEQVGPTLARMDQERVLVFGQMVATAIGRITLVDTNARAEHVRQDESIMRRHARDFFPAGAGACCPASTRPAAAVARGAVGRSALAAPRSARTSRAPRGPRGGLRHPARLARSPPSTADVLALVIAYTLRRTSFRLVLIELPSPFLEAWGAGVSTRRFDVSTYPSLSPPGWTRQTCRTPPRLEPDRHPPR